MSYPLINGASINSSGGSSEAPLVPTRGIPMALSGTQTAARVLLVPSADALALGALRIQIPIRPSSLALAQGGVPTAKFQATLYPAPLPMAVEGQAQLVLTVFPESADALALGAAKVKTGTDVELKSWGLGMCVAGQVTATQTQPQPSVTYQVPGARAMRYGAAAIELPSIVLKPQGSDALRMGSARMVQVAKAAPSQAMAFGQPRTVQIVKPASGHALTLGRPGVRAGLRPVGIALAVGGVPSVSLAQRVLQVESADALQLGYPGPLAYAFHVRQSFALELSRPTVARTHQC
ncbi:MULTISPECIES: hypothetical protein [Comamonas]|uniref:hypothetical protein n=1 Tax=Comamonas TaxID=283 RepID=UPI0001DA6E41|nr:MULTISPECIES: hypothetical protein [Comamonas]EFI61339.1 hypothetical protein CTS44_12809 [Comamonas thiooxydans]TFF62667.1 hypothetical protein EIC84_00905 [Comamonas sp. A23]